MNKLRLIFVGPDEMGFVRFHRASFQFHVLAICTGLFTSLIVVLHTRHEILPTFTMVDVLHTDVDFLRNDACSKNQEKLGTNKI